MNRGNMGKGFAGLPGGGPWRILAECQADNHNSAAAAKGGGRNVGKPKCICPHGREAKNEQNRKLRMRKRRAAGYAAVGEAIQYGDLRKLVERVSAPVKEQPPAMLASVCRNPVGVKIMTAAFDAQLSADGERQRQAAKTLCRGCPERAGCLAYVERNESPAGSWGGVWGGQDAWNRAGWRLVYDAQQVGVVRMGESE